MRIRSPALALFLALSPLWCHAAIARHGGISTQAASQCDVRAIEEKATLGDPAAQVDLGYAHETGCGKPKNFSIAAHWYRLAAEQGHAMGQSNLGNMYRDGKGVPRDMANALQWYRKSAEQGHPYGQTNLGWMYEEGYGVPRDLEQAFKYYLLAARQGDAQAQRTVGRAYVNGAGVQQDYQQGLEWYRKAAANGDAEVMSNLGWLYEQGWGVSRDYDIAAQWYRRGAEMGEPQAQNNLGAAYSAGHGVPKNARTAVEWYRKAAAQGLAIAQRNLGDCYRDGDGVPIDGALAVEWYRMAAEAGDTAAQARLGFMYLRGQGIPKDGKEALRWFEKFNATQAAAGGKTEVDRKTPRKIDAQAFQVSGAEAKQEHGRFRAELLFAADEAMFYKAWNSAGEDLKLPVTERVPVGRPAHAFVLFEGCTPNEAGKCTVSVSYRIYQPDGSLHSVSTTEFPLRDAPADEALALSQPGSIHVTDIDPVGAYLVVARIHDTVSNLTFDLRKLIQVSK